MDKRYVPPVDHTTNSSEGRYLLADGLAGRTGDITSLVSPEISFTNARCALDFWYYCSMMFGCSLDAYVGKEGAMKRVWSADEAQSSKYSLAFLSFSVIVNIIHLRQLDSSPHT